MKHTPISYDLCPGDGENGNQPESKFQLDLESTNTDLKPNLTNFKVLKLINKLITKHTEK